uniref:Ig-like domain-containing protein n=1 Tax=Xiphophorus couchianus TaxID=32473 RepID=A0A3B5MGA0_9TELE
MMTLSSAVLSGQHQITVDSAVESVLLPCRTTDHLPGDARVEWIKSSDRKAHVYENGSDRPGEQSQYYRTRTKMDEEPLKTGDLSLTLRWPTDGDSEIFTCKVSIYSYNGNLQREKTVLLKVKGLFLNFFNLNITFRPHWILSLSYSKYFCIVQFSFFFLYSNFRRKMFVELKLVAICKKIHTITIRALV